MNEGRDKPTPLRGAIVAMTRDRVIGVDGKLPWHYSEDLKRFKRRTMGCVVIMGRVTWDSIGRKALPGRRNIVISRSAVAGVECYTDIEAALIACENEDIWIIGGSQIYHAAMPYLNLLDVTYVPDVVEREGVVRFPEIDLTCWRVVEESILPSDEGLSNIVYHHFRHSRESGNPVNQFAKPSI